MDTIVPLSSESIGIQHQVPAGNNFTGIRPSTSELDDTTVLPKRNVVVVPTLAGDGGGLFLPSDYLKMDQRQAYVTHVILMSSATFGWSINVTSGLGDGSATTVDDPVLDMELFTGNDSVHQRMNIELLQTQSIRITTTGGAQPIYAIVLMANTAGDGGRLIS